MAKGVMSYVALVWAIGLSIASLIMPPLGVIDSSVLILIAQIIIFISTLVGITLPSSFTKFKDGSNSK